MFWIKQKMHVLYHVDAMYWLGHKKSDIVQGNQKSGLIARLLSSVFSDGQKDFNMIGDFGMYVVDKSLMFFKLLVCAVGSMWVVVQ